MRADTTLAGEMPQQERRPKGSVNVTQGTARPGKHNPFAGRAAGTQRFKAAKGAWPHEAV